MKTRDYFWPLKACLDLDRIFRIALFLLLILVGACSGLKLNNVASSWPSSTPEKQGMDSKQLLKMLDFIEEKQYNLHSFLVLRHGTLVLEAYYSPFGPQDKQMLFSVTKSIVSALVGIALKDGKIQSVDQPVLDFFPNVSIANLNECKKNIHLRDLLNMTSGLTADDEQMGESPDWSQFTLNQLCSVEPGTTFDYNTGNFQLLSAIVQKTSGKTTFEYAREKLFEPLGIRDVYWAADPSGATQGGLGLMLTPRDMAKFGFLYLHKGQWKGLQIVPAEWVDTSIQKNENGYAYAWLQQTNGYSAGGTGGQIIYVIPSEDLVVVSTAGLPESTQTVVWDLADEFVFNAVKSDQPIPGDSSAIELADRLVAIANPKAQAVPALPATASSINGKTLRLNENSLGWKTAKLVFEGQQAWLTVTTAAAPQEQKFAVGLDGLYRKTELKRVETLGIAKPKQRHFRNPYEFNFLLGIPVDGVVAMKGEWSGENEFWLTVQDTRDFDLDKLSFKFTPPSAEIWWRSTMDQTILDLTGEFD